jgi:hypothetical protein
VDVVASNKLFIIGAGVVAAVALTVGVVSAGLGSNEQDVDPSPTESASPTPDTSPTPEASPAPTPEATEEPVDEPTSTEDAESEDDEVEGEGDAAGNQKIAEVLAEEFGTTPEAVLALHDQGIGFGALFKLYSIARAKGITIEALLAEIEAGGGGFAFGKLKKSLTEEETAILEDGPKNLGELVSGSNHDDSGDEAPETESGEDQSSSGGPPGHAKAKGHKKKN